MPIDVTKVPSYDRLPVKEGAPAGSAWGVFGDNDQLGCLNLITPEAIVEAAGLIRKGAVFPLNLPLTEPDPPIFGREALKHHLLERSSYARDDYLDSFWLQVSSQWDALRHMRHPQDGFYNGVKDEEIVAGDKGKLGIEQVAKRGIVGRGVLLDVERYLKQQGKPYGPRERTIIDKDILAGCARWEKVPAKPGDILLIHTGWLRWYLREATPEERQGMGGDAWARGGFQAPGIGPGEEMARYLWDLHVAAVAADNPSLEAWPPPAEAGLLHFRLIPYLGLLMGELWYLEELAADCAEDGVYEFMVTSVPLNLPGGVGSPANALAIK